jgi:glycosyltransferase involved in cell wall biosynthesis
MSKKENTMLKERKGKKGNKEKDTKLLPFVSLCTPTFNRRPFFDIAIRCFQHQIYPKERMEWIILDDGTDKIEDKVKDIPQVRYFSYNDKMTLGKKRNLIHEKAKGDILVYFDDDDYYPPERVSHAVETLVKNPEYKIAGSSEMHMYFKHNKNMYQFGPYGPNHATAATFAFRKELLRETTYNENASLAEEKEFLKNYTIPLKQLDTEKTILVFSHIHNSFDKKLLLEQGMNKYLQPSTKKVEDYIQDHIIYSFFMDKIDTVLSAYEYGNPKYKPDVLKQTQEMIVEREARQKEMGEIHKLRNEFDTVIKRQETMIQMLTKENILLKEKVVYLEGKIKILIDKCIQDKRGFLS